MSDEIRPFRIDVPQADLDDLVDRLARTRWPRQLPGGSRRGVPVAQLRELAEYWRAGFDWRGQEARLNGFPQFLTEIDGQQIHFLHVRSPESDALPLVITHSWPNSVAEFVALVGPLADRGFHVVAPSLPGFGWSTFPEPADERPWTAERVARTWAELMARLGYERYGAHGNDAGAVVSPQLALVDAEHLVGVHMTGGVGVPTGDPTELDGLTDAERAGLERMAALFAGGSGYATYLANRPQTLAYGWLDSPVAQLAYLVERLAEFDGWPTGADALLPHLDRDQLLTTVSLYWFTGTGGSSSWTYYDGAAGMPIDQAVVPTGVSHGGPDAFRRIAERGNDITQWSGREAASHMVAMVDADGLATDIAEFFAKTR
jgi:epoxide hydrolase